MSKNFILSHKFFADMYMFMLQTAVPPSEAIKTIMKKNNVQSVQGESVMFFVSDLDDVNRLSKNGININGNNVAVVFLQERNEAQHTSKEKYIDYLEREVQLLRSQALHSSSIVPKKVVW